MWFSIVYCLFFISKNTKNTSKSFELKAFDEKNIIGDYLGETGSIDIKLFEPELDKTDKIYEISRNLRKLSVIKSLEQVDLSIIEKIRLVQEYEYYIETNKYISNLTNGGLYNDWNFTL